ncbi:IPT/TIG domain-containing protein [Nonomuraea sp. B12E4]|uniref:IPT/TIG domain-containing protein n=1 Tax=Nonomuraea sp. B12E4 TaxID=3153564 RepID=UPI00325C9092
MAPVITSISVAPQNTNQGSYGQTLTVNGTGLGTTVTGTIRIGAKSVTPATNTGTVATCVLPSGCGQVSVSVVVSGAGGGTSNGLPLYFIGSPFVAEITPTEGSATAPSAVTLAGEALLTTNQVQFQGVTGTLVPPTSDTQVTATPAPIAELDAAPWFQVRSASVRTAGGTFTVPSALALFDTPAITDLDPDTGPAGTEVVITGTGFVGSSISVTFGGVDADFTSMSDTQILATAPTGPVAGAQDVVVSTPGGDSVAATFTYV